MDLEALLKALSENGIEPHHLDDVVHDAASTMASNANNGGLNAQIQFLTTSIGWSYDEILKEAIANK